MVEHLLGVALGGAKLVQLIARFRDIQWQEIWCIVGLKVDQNKTTAVRGTVKRRNQ